MAGRTPRACLAILAVLVTAVVFAAAASAVTVCTESTTACGPAMQLSKSGPSYVNQGDSAQYTFSLYNSGTDDISDVTVADDKCSPMSAPQGDDGDGILNPGETWTYTCSYAPAGNPGDAVTNNATADGTALGEVPVHAEASHTTWITALHVDKSVDLSSADPYDELHYTIKISNEGPDFFNYEGYLDDEGCSDLQSSDSNTDGNWFSVAPGESVTYTCHHNFDGTQPYTNEACADASVYQTEVLALSTQESSQGLRVCDSATTTVATHAVSGTVFDDLNADGARQDTEPPVSGVVVYADQNNNGVRDEGEANSTSDGQGHYSVSVALGTTTIREETPAGSTCSYPAGCSYTVDLPKNSAPEPAVLSRKAAARADDPTGKDFGNWRPASVTGTVIGDDNGNGARDSGEHGLAGIAVFADLDGNGVLDQGEPSTTSAADGTYALTGLKPGGYVIRHVLVQDGRSCTAPAGCNYDLTLVSGQAAGNKDFLDAKQAQAVLGARITPGNARMTGKTGCVTGNGFYARIRGTKMQRIVFSVDGRRVKAVNQPRSNRTYRYRVNVAHLAIGVHSVSAKITFRAGTNTKTKTIRLTFQRCAKQLRAPAFTG